MNQIDGNYSEQVIELEKRLKELPREKRKVWRLIVMGIICPFIGPYFPFRKGFLADRMGYQNSVLMFAVMVVIFFPIAGYMHYQKINNQIFDVELELDILNRKIQKGNDKDL